MTLLTPSDEPTGAARTYVSDFRIEGVHINLENQQQALSGICRELRNKRSFSVFTLNLDHCVKIRGNEAFRRIYHAAHFVTADGAPIVFLARVLGIKIERVTGADLVDPLCALSEKEGFRIFLFGSSNDVLEKAAAFWRERYPNLIIAGTLAPSPAFSPGSAEAETAIATIASSRSDLCLVALGAPKQELFSATAAERIEGCGFVCIGAALDFIAGTQVRAPVLFRNLGIEWIWRLANQPKRMGQRYFDCAMLMTKYLFQAPRLRAQRKTHIGVPPPKQAG